MPFEKGLMLEIFEITLSSYLCFYIIYQNGSMINKWLFQNAIDIGIFQQSYVYILHFTVFYLCITLGSFIVVGFVIRHFHSLQNPMSRTLKTCCPTLVHNMKS